MELQIIHIMEERLDRIEKILRLLQQKIKDNETKIEEQETNIKQIEKKMNDGIGNAQISGQPNEEIKILTEKIDKMELVIRKISEKVKCSNSEGEVSSNEHLLQKIDAQRRIVLTLQDVSTRHESTINELIGTIEKINTTAIPVLRQTIVSLNQKVSTNKSDILELQSRVTGISNSGSVGEPSVELIEVKQIKNDNREMRETIKLMKQQLEAHNEMMKGSINKINEVTTMAKGRPASEMFDHKAIEQFNEQMEKELQKKDEEIVSLKTAQHSLKKEIENLKGLKNEVEEIKRMSLSSSYSEGFESSPKVRGKSISISTTNSTCIQSLIFPPTVEETNVSNPITPPKIDLVPKVTEKEIEGYISELNVCENMGGYYRTLSNWCNFQTPRILFFSNNFERLELSEFNKSMSGLANVMIIVGNKKNETFGTFSSKMIPLSPGSAAKKDKDCTFISDDPTHFIFSLSNGKAERRKFILQPGYNDTIGIYSDKSKEHIFICSNLFVLKRKEGKFFDNYDKAYGCCNFPICESKTFKPSFIVAIQWSG